MKEKMMWLWWGDAHGEEGGKGLMKKKRIIQLIWIASVRFWFVTIPYNVCMCSCYAQFPNENSKRTTECQLRLYSFIGIQIVSARNLNCMHFITHMFEFHCILKYECVCVSFGEIELYINIHTHSLTHRERERGI